MYIGTGTSENLVIYKPGWDDFSCLNLQIKKIKIKKNQLLIVKMPSYFLIPTFLEKF
jgi:hypothetical protein